MAKKPNKSLENPVIGPLEGQGAGTKQRNLKEFSDIEQIQLRSLISDTTKVSIQHKKVLSVFLSIDVKGKFQVVYFGAAPEIRKRAKYLADKIADMIPALITSYDIPKMDQPGEDEAAEA